MNVILSTEIGVSSAGQPTANSVSCIIWGLTTDSTDPLQNTVHRWHKINRILVLKGVAHMTENFNAFDKKSQICELDEINFDVKYATFDKWLSELNNATKESSSSPASNTPSDTLIQFSDSDSTNVSSDHWKPAEPFKKAIFAACITYVDDNGILYMYDLQKKSVLNDIRVAIDEHCIKLAIDSTQKPTVIWAKNDACLAKFHLDGQFHRAVVQADDDGSGEINVRPFKKCESATLLMLEMFFYKSSGTFRRLRQC